MKNENFLTSFSCLYKPAVNLLKLFNVGGLWMSLRRALVGFYTTVWRMWPCTFTSRCLSQLQKQRVTVTNVSLEVESGNINEQPAQHGSCWNDYNVWIATLRSGVVNVYRFKGQEHIRVWLNVCQGTGYFCVIYEWPSTADGAEILNSALKCLKTIRPLLYILLCCEVTFSLVFPIIEDVLLFI